VRGRRTRWTIAVALVFVAAGALGVALALRVRGSTSSETTAGGPESSGAISVVAVGDIARCDSEGDEQTARLVAQTNMQILALGDLAYGSGSAEDFSNCYDPDWGQFRDRTHPVPGNHEYETPRAQGYFDYFGDGAGGGFYSFDLGAWHLVALNSNCGDDSAGCELSDPQLDWLEHDMQATSATCVLAYWHHPRFSSGEHGDDDSVAAFWGVLDENGADVVLNGHDHDYERFAPQDPTGEARDDGIREFVVGTGGGLLRDFSSSAAENSEFRLANTYGVLELTLRPDGYDWRFLTTDDRTADEGSAACH